MGVSASTNAGGDGDAAFTVLTYNINDKDVVSHSAPPGWSVHKNHRALWELIATVHRPDLLCLQECNAFPARLKGHYVVHGTTASHKGNCIIATRIGSPLRAAGPAFVTGPCIVVPLNLHGRCFYAACAHLMPRAGNEGVRAQQLAAIAAALPQDLPVVLAGDMNMREHETPETQAHGLQDAWLEAGGLEEDRWTWNTHVNRYYENGREYTARYDRVLHRGCRVLRFGLAGNKPCSDNAHHFASDHFAVVATLQVP